MSTEFNSADGKNWIAKTDVGEFTIEYSEGNTIIKYNGKVMCKGVANLAYAFESALAFYETFKNISCKCKHKKP